MPIQRNATRGRGNMFLKIFLVIALTSIKPTLAGPSTPQYKPFYAENFDSISNTNNSVVSSFEISTTPQLKTYSSEIAGPFRDGIVVKQEIEVLKRGFGGRIASTNLGQGQEIWVRWYEYFPENFIFANSTVGSDGGAGALKWLRFQYPGNSQRMTILLDGTGRCTSPCNNGQKEIVPDSIQTEGLNWKNRYGNIGIRMNSKSFSTGQWRAIQVYLRLSTGSAERNDGNGLIRMWVDDSLVGEYEHSTLPSDGGRLQSIWWGNYWNGGAPRTQHWYFDEVIMTSQRPYTRDVNGNYYIHPSTQVAHFNDVITLSPPMPPTFLLLDIK